jgi:hypothetical protein
MCRVGLKELREFDFIDTALRVLGSLVRDLVYSTALTQYILLYNKLLTLISLLPKG